VHVWLVPFGVHVPLPVSHGPGVLQATGVAPVQLTALVPVPVQVPLPATKQLFGEQLAPMLATQVAVVPVP